MKVAPHKTERLHSLDSLRAIMMLLGLVLHSAITYAVSDYGRSWGIKDPNTVHISNELIGSLVHAFRMQAFFLVAGFFGALLFYDRSPWKMVKNRVLRIVLPLIVFWIVLRPTINFSFGYTKLKFLGNPDAFAETLAKVLNWEIFIPKSTFHLWFLYYLAMITFFVALVALVFKKLPKLSDRISMAFAWVIQRPLTRLLVFGGLTAVVYSIMGTGSVATSNSTVPDFNTFIYYLSFYLVGWVLFKSKHLLDTFLKYDWISTVLAFAIYTAYFFTYESFSLEAKILLKSIVVWLFIFGITGLFIRYASNHSVRMRYISDSSYWVYLIHLPLTALIPAFIFEWPIPSTLKFLIVLLSTGIICFVTYHYFVRSTFIGAFLNGRKYPRKLPKKSAEAAIGRMEAVATE